jgi:hypothetical protein
MGAWSAFGPPRSRLPLLGFPHKSLEAQRCGPKLFIDTCSGRPQADTMENRSPPDGQSGCGTVDRSTHRIFTVNEAYDIPTRTIRLSRVARRRGLRCMVLPYAHPPTIRSFRLTSLKTTPTAAAQQMNAEKFSFSCRDLVNKLE